MEKQRLNRFVLSALDGSELCGRLLQRRAGPRVAIFDLDGTVHRGMCYRLGKGLSVVDLSLYLGMLLLPHPAEWLSYTRHLRTFRKQVAARRRSAAGSGLEDDIPPDEIRRFVDDVLQGLPYRDLERAAVAVSRLHFRGVRYCIRQVGQPCHRCAFVSRALTPVLEAYAQRLFVPYGIAIDAFGNSLTVDRGVIRALDPQHCVLSAKDKCTLVQDLLRLPQREQGDTIIFANGHEDLAMFQIADELLGSQRALKVAVKPTSPLLAAAADVVVDSWTGLQRLIRQWEGHLGRSAR